MSAISPSIPAEVSPIIEAYAKSIRPAFTFILISAVFSAILAALLLMLFALSTSHSRRQPIFILNLLTITLGLVVGILSNHLTISSILSPLAGVNPTEDLVYNVLYVWLPWITEAILVLRVIVVYMPGYTGRIYIARILGFSILIKAARVAINIVFLIQWKQSTFSGSNINQFDITRGLDTWTLKTAWILELVDNLYISGLFLWRLASKGHLFNPKSTGRESQSEGNTIASFTSKIQSLFWIATTNLIFPLIFNLLQIIIISTADNILLAAAVEMAGIYVAIISTAFATIWAATSSFKDAHPSVYKRGGSRSVPEETILEPLEFESDTQY